MPSPSKTTRDCASRPDAGAEKPCSSGARYVVRYHAGRSGKSVFRFRVYHVGFKRDGSGQTQLGKYRTPEEAERARAHHEANAVRVAAVNARFAARDAAKARSA